MPPCKGSSEGPLGAQPPSRGFAPEPGWQCYGAVLWGSKLPRWQGLCHGAVTPQPPNTLQTWKATSGTCANQDRDTSWPGRQVAGSSRGFGQAGYDEQAGTESWHRAEHLLC